MSGAENENTNNTPTTEKPFGITNIRTYVPITLDLDAMNYDAWRTLFQAFLISFGLRDHVTAPPPDPKTPQWEKHDSLLTLWLYGTLAPSLLTTILKPGATACEVWNSLKDLFHDNKESRAIQLDLKLRTLDIGDMNITTYYQRIKSLADQLANIGQPVPERNLVMYMINGLGEHFSQVTSIIRHQRPLPSFSEVWSMLTIEGTQLLKPSRTPTTTHRDSSSSPTILLAGSADSTCHTPQSDDRRRNFSSDRRGDDRRWEDRRADDRRGSDRRRGNGRRQQQDRHQFNNGGGGNSMPPWAAWGPFCPPWAAAPMWPSTWPYTPSNQHHPTSGGSSRLPSQQPAQPGAYFTAQWPNGTDGPAEQPITLPQAFQSMNLQDPANSEWFMDTGATNHLSSDSGNLRTIFNKRSISSILVGNGASIPVTNMGHGILPSPHRPLHLHNVLVTPNIIKNLISIRKFTTDNDVSIEFDKLGFSVKDP
ncbi:hypothetical protein LXL04_005842 [Taraxacum kok-saghyz]